jgi:adenine-specific DNA-methyltransferase
MFSKQYRIADQFDPDERVVVFPGDCLELLRTCPDETFQLIVTSPPYNIGKEYEKRLKLETYIGQQAEVIRECVRCLSPQGSICWQVGKHLDNNSGDGSNRQCPIP